MKHKIPVIMLQGPTAVGKSALAFEIAGKLNTDIISADSRQVYKFLDIGTAKPSQEDQQLVKHHLIDIVFPDQEYNAGKFAQDATYIIQDLTESGKVPFIVGGTGFYTKALISGLAVIPEVPRQVREKLYQQFREHGSENLYLKLSKADPVAAKGIKQNDIQKLLRALEVYEYTGKPISFYWQEQLEKKIFQPLNIFLTDSREKIYQRIDHRVELMMKYGLLSEIETLLKKGYKEDDPGMNTVGYKEFYPYFRREKALDICIEEAKKNTRNLAKRQFTWFKKIDFDLTLDASNINISYIIDKINGFLKSTKGDL